MKRSLILLLLAALLSGTAQAHKASDSFLYWQPADVEAPGRLDIALTDLARTVSLDGDGDGQLLWSEIIARQDSIRRYLTPRLRAASGDLLCQMNWRMAGLTQHSDGNYLVVEFRPDCFDPAIVPATLRYNLFFDEDPLHRSLVMTRIDGNDRLSVLGPNQQELSLVDNEGVWHTVVEFVWEGMVHLWIGYDHMLFLLALLLPAAVRREQGRWVVEDRLAVAVKDVVNIIWPFLGTRRYLVGFGFGLIHGFGFASVLADFMTDTSSRLIALASFNIGVELAQLAVVACVVPLIFVLRRQWLYQRVVLPAGVCMIAAIGSVWVWERVPL